MKLQPVSTKKCVKQNYAPVMQSGKWDICEDITKPRTEAAIAGKTPKGEPIKGDCKFTDEFYTAESLGILAK